MIGPSYWSTGITISQDEAGWHVTLDFCDDGFCNQASTEGRLYCRYVVRDLTAAVDTLVADAASLGIVWKSPTVYYQGDGEWADFPPPPKWRETTNAQARRLGWRESYQPTGAIPSKLAEENDA